MRTIVGALLAMLFASGLMTNAANAAGLVRRLETLEYSITLRETPGYRIKNFPESIRHVPLHNDDQWLNGSPYMMSALPDTTLHLAESVAFEFGVGYRISRFAGLGLLVGLHSTANSTRDSDDRYQQNQWGTAERIEGASLRYYQAVNRITQLGFQAYVGTPWAVLKQARFRLRTGGVVDLTGMSIAAEGGWDRWGGDESWKKTTIAHVHEHTAFIRGEIGWADTTRTSARTVISFFVQGERRLHQLSGDRAAPLLSAIRERNPTFELSVGFMLSPDNN